MQEQEQRMNSLQNREMPPTLYAVGFSPWKRRSLRAFLPGTQLHFIEHIDCAPPHSSLLLWGDGDLGGQEERKVIRVEDGFLRSVGLGADLIPPFSYVFDHSGLYYDPGRPSDLETLLQHFEMNSDLLARAQRLRKHIVTQGLTKYNVGGITWRRPPHARHVILVPGQVESDASIRLGCTSIRTNMQLLRQVRAQHPGSYLVYKPHPDVVARLRRPGADEGEAPVYCDEVVTDVSMHVLLEAVDAVHVLTSSTGFEALLRAKPVTCHGVPFYSGWGLTDDRIPVARRRRRRSLDELVAAVLILYPRYLHPLTKTLCRPEEAIAGLGALREHAPDRRTPLWRKGFRMVLRHVVGVR